MCRKTCSPTQPGRGIRKIVDLYHDLPDLVNKAGKHAAYLKLGTEGMVDIDDDDFVGLTKDDIDEE